MGHTFAPSTVVAVISLVVAAATFALTYLQPARVVPFLGSSILAYYTQGGAFSFYLPLTFINKAAATGTIPRAAVTLYRKDMPETRYFMQWRSFSKFDAERNVWVFERMAHALAIPGRSAVSETVWFSWPEESSDQIVIREGAYTLILHWWTAKDGPPASETHDLAVTGFQAQRLEGWRQSKNSATIHLSLDKRLAENRIMTEHEQKSLLNA